MYERYVSDSRLGVADNLDSNNNNNNVDDDDGYHSRVYEWCYSFIDYSLSPNFHMKSAQGEDEASQQEKVVIFLHIR